MHPFDKIAVVATLSLLKAVVDGFSMVASVGVPHLAVVSAILIYERARLLDR